MLDEAGAVDNEIVLVKPQTFMNRSAPNAARDLLYEFHGSRKISL